MRVLYLLVVAILALARPAFGAVVDPYTVRLNEETETFVLCTDLEKERALCDRLNLARAWLKDVTITTFDRREGKKSVPYREFALAAYDPLDDKFHTIRLAMPKDIKKQPNFQPIVLTESDPPYQVTRLRGQSLNKMVFQIRQGDRELYAYAGKHLLFTEEKLHPFWGGKTIEFKEEVMYLATPPYLVNEEFAQAGQALFMKAIERAFMELRESGTPSLAYPDRLLVDAVTANEVAHLIVAEQTDPCFLAKRPKGCERLIPVRPYPSDDMALQAVNTEFVINGLAAFRHMRSSASARGVLQFTDNANKKKRYAGTYSTVVTRYPKAGIDPDFRRGSKSISNLAKAAACLIDLELSNRKIPEWVRQAFLVDREFVMPVPGAAYNGGPSQSQRLTQFFKSFIEKHDIDLEEITFDSFPWEGFLSWIDQGKTRLKPETRGYIEKIIKIRDHLRRHRPKATEVNFEGELA